MAKRNRRKDPPDEPGEYIFRRSFRHWRSGKIITAPPGKMFRFRVD